MKGGFGVKEGSYITYAHLLGDVDLGSESKSGSLLWVRGCANCQGQLYLKYPFYRQSFRFRTNNKEKKKSISRRRGMYCKGMAKTYLAKKQRVKERCCKVKSLMGLNKWGGSGGQTERCFHLRKVLNIRYVKTKGDICYIYYILYRKRNEEAWEKVGAGVIGNVNHIKCNACFTSHWASREETDGADIILFTISGRILLLSGKLM